MLQKAQPFLSAVGGIVPDMDELDDTEQAILATAKMRWAYDGAKAGHVRTTLGLTLAAYAQRLHVLLEDPRAEAVEPALVHRLRRLRDRRAAARVGSAAWPANTEGLPSDGYPVAPDGYAVP